MIRRLALSLFLLSCWLSSAPCRAALMVTYDLDSRCYSASEIVEADLGAPATE